MTDDFDYGYDLTATAQRCTITDCKRPYYARGYCEAHYAHERRYGTPLSIRPSLPMRFWPRVEFTATCWLWRGSKWDNGYGRIDINGKRIKAHRWAYEFCVGPIPAGLTIDHLCRVRHCVNPDHLEPVTSRENTLRGEGACARWARATHCPKGHPYAGANLWIHGKRLQRGCRACSRLRGKAWYWERGGREQRMARRAG